MLIDSGCQFFFFLILSSHSVFKTLLAGNELNQEISFCYFDYFILFEDQAFNTFILMSLIETGIYDPKPRDLCNEIPHHNNKAFLSGMLFYH